MRHLRIVGSAVMVASVVAIVWSARMSTDMEARTAQAADQVPIFVWDPTWPKTPLPNSWTLGNVSGVTVDSKDHIWILHRPFSITHGSEDHLEHDPPTASCCRMAPPVIEFDHAGNVGQSWGGPGEGYEWPQHAVADMHKPHSPIEDWSGEHGVYADHTDHFWITNNAPKGSDAHVLKFTRSGKHVLTVGTIGKGKGSNDTTALGKPAGIVVDPKTNEAFIADGYTNRRVIVFDAATGACKRHWGAYGKPPNDSEKEPGCVPGATPSQFNTPHAVRLSRDGLLYVSDRGNCRIQAFKTDGTYVNEVFLGLAPGGSASAAMT